MNCIQKAFKRTDLNKKKIEMFAPGSKGFKAMSKRLNKTVKTKVKKTAKKAAKNEMKKEMRGSRPKRGRGRGRGGSVRAFERVVRNEMKQNLGYRSEKQATRPKLGKENIAPWHPLFGSGERRTFEYIVRTIGRTGSSNTSSMNSDSKVGAIPTSQNTEINIFRMTTGTGTYVYDSCLVFDTPVWNHEVASSAGPMQSSVLYTNETKGEPQATKVVDWLKYKQRFFVRQIDLKYNPSTDRTTKGNLTFGIKNVPYAGVDHIKETTYEDVFNLNKELKKKSTNVGEPLELKLLPPYEMNRAAPGDPYTVQKGTDLAEYSLGSKWVIMGACNVVLPNGTADVLGTVSLKYTIDAYGDSWDPCDIMPTVSTSSNATTQGSGVVSSDSKETKQVSIEMKETLDKLMAEKKEVERLKRVQAVDDLTKLMSSSTTSTDTSKAKVLTSDQQKRLIDLMKRDPNAQ
jgi:hypothetical protein